MGAPGAKGLVVRVNMDHSKDRNGGALGRDPRKTTEKREQVGYGCCIFVFNLQ